jgi:hypothetical protein
MSTYLSSKNGVKARKPHRCCLCGARIAVGEIHDTRTGVIEGDGFWTMRMHPDCHLFEQHGKRIDYAGRTVCVVDPDWYEDTSDPAFDRSEAKAFAEKLTSQPA